MDTSLEGTRMLSKIVNAFREADGPLDMRELSRRLGIERSALDGMLDVLVRQGKLREVTPKVCAHCGKSGRCDHELKGYTGSKVYELVE
jgi:predicted Zn-ribbon and HTH transcriptional regulator